MAILKEITDDLKQVLRGIATAGNAVNKASRKSFARGANEQSFQFPCLISSSSPVDMASTMVRNLDRLYASFVQIYLSGEGIIDLNYIKNPRQFIAQYQSQFSLENSIDDEEIDEFMEYYKDFTEAGNAMFVDDNNNIVLLYQEGTCSPTMKEKLKKGMETVDTLYNTKAVPTYEANEDIKKRILQDYSDDIENQKKLEELKVTSKIMGPRLTDMDVKKLNDMQPYVLELKLLATKGDTSFSEYINYDVGIKTTLHLGKSDVIIQNIVYILKNKNPMFNFIRWTTGELSLMKDIILNLNDINFNVANRYDPTGKFISALKKMKKTPVKVTTNGLSKVIPFATIVITSYEYSTILNEYGFDLKNVTFANKVMSELYLLCFAIIDEGSRTIDILLDGHTSGFQTYSLDILEKETTMNSNKLGKEFIRMLGGN